MTSPLDTFDLICCINLPHSVDRWKVCEQEFAKLSISKPVVKVWATPPQQNIVAPGLSFPKGEIGVSLSQSKAILMALNSNAESVLIFEDDVMFDNYNEQKVAAALSELPTDWDLLYLGGKPIEPLTKVTTNLAKTKRFYGAYAYAVSRKFMHTLLATTLDKVTTTPYDCVLAELSLTHNFYCLYPPICQTHPGPSVIRHNQFRSYQVDTQKHWRQHAPK